MKIAIQRHGIVLRTLEISGSSARIGSAPECEVALDDPYLSGHIADLVQRADGWYIVDTAASLEGVTRNGVRIDEERIAGGETYTIGGFELVPQVAPAAVAPREISRTVAEPLDEALFPRTMMETELPPSAAGEREVPLTMMDTELPEEVRAIPSKSPAAASAPPRQHAAPKLDGFTPVKTSGGGVGVPSRAAKKKPKPLLLVAAALGVLIVLMLVIAIATGDSDEPAKVAKKPVAARPSPPPATLPPTTADPVVRGNELLGKLQPDDALTAWESALAQKADPVLQDRYSELAVELGMLSAAANDRQKARSYFERAAKFGRADSGSVLIAKARLAQ